MRHGDIDVSGSVLLSPNRIAEPELLAVPDCRYRRIWIGSKSNDSESGSRIRSINFVRPLSAGRLVSYNCNQTRSIARSASRASHATSQPLMSYDYSEDDPTDTSATPGLEDQSNPLSVSQLTLCLKRLIEGSLPSVWLERRSRI